MPNTPLTVGAGACLISRTKESLTAHVGILKKILGGDNLCTEVPESMMDSLGALVGCGPAYVSIFIVNLIGRSSQSQSYYLIIK